MNVHKNARLTPHRRVELVGRISAGERVIEVARQLGVSRRTV
ncbi:MAG: IS481 family transposase, partial [Candidatus Rokuibacteriota bacterium]